MRKQVYLPLGGSAERDFPVAAGRPSAEVTFGSDHPHLGLFEHASWSVLSSKKRYAGSLGYFAANRSNLPVAGDEQ
jgi:hypothetical protein